MRYKNKDPNRPNMIEIGRVRVDENSGEQTWEYPNLHILPPVLQAELNRGHHFQLDDVDLSRVSDEVRDKMPRFHLYVGGQKCAALWLVRDPEKLNRPWFPKDQSMGKRWSGKFSTDTDRHGHVIPHPMNVFADVPGGEYSNGAFVYFHSATDGEPGKGHLKMFEHDLLWVRDNCPTFPPANTAPQPVNPPEPKQEAQALPEVKPFDDERKPHGYDTPHGGVKGPYDNEDDIAKFAFN